MSAPARAGRPWTSRELLIALDLAASGIDCAEIARTLHRTKVAVESAVSKSGGMARYVAKAPDSFLHAGYRGSVRWFDLLAAAGECRSRQRGWRP